MNNIYKLTNPFDYSRYREMLFQLADSGGSTGLEHSEQRKEATKMNAQRIKRIDKTFTLSFSSIEKMKSIKEKYFWIVIAESWCGDAAQNLPIINKLATLNNKIELSIILRDENEQIMNMHLTNGTKSIPKLICLNEQKELIGEWGPRPAEIAKQVSEYKLSNPQVTHDDFVKNLHLLYAKNKGLALETELVQLISEWTAKK